MNRRSFLGATAAALAQGGEVRTAFIGVGRRGVSLVEQVIEQPGAPIAAICDTDPQARDRALSLAARYKPRSFTDYRQMLDGRDFDAVVIATPCDLHAPMAAACLEAGKYVYCEKPLGITPEQVQQVLDASRRSRAFLQIGQQLRYFPGFRAAIARIHEGVAGTPFVIKAQRHSTPVSPQSEATRPAWYADVRRSGDLIVENAVHNLDVCNWVADSRPTSAYGHGKKYLPKSIPAGSVMMDGFSVEYTYDNDMHLDYSQLYLHPRALRELANGQWYIVFGEKGAVNVSQGVFYPFDGDKAREIVAADVRDGKEDAMTQFYASIREKRPPFADIRVGAVAALTAIMGREAIYRRRMVTWKELGVNVA